MKQIITSLIVCLVATAASAQHNLAVTYKVFDCDTDSGEPRSYEMTLVADFKKSLYYNKESLYCDSCCSTPEGKARLRDIQLKAWRVVQPDGTVTYDGRKLGLAPEKKEYLYVAKNSQSGEQTVYDYFGDGQYCYTEPMDDIKWTVMIDSTKIILSYECFKAKTDYHGREWNVWFTPEIPISNGPWKLQGLQGIILSADGGDNFHIEATEVGTTEQQIPDVYSVNEYQVGERRRLLADKEHYYNNLESMLAAQGISLNGDGTPANLPEYNRQKRAWETDY